VRKSATKRQQNDTKDKIPLPPGVTTPISDVDVVNAVTVADDMHAV
jgi:hypothetical protein